MSRWMEGIYLLQVNGRFTVLWCVGPCPWAPHLASHSLNLVWLSVTFESTTIMIHTILCCANSSGKEMRGNKGKCFHQVYLLVYNIPACSCPCSHHGKEVTYATMAVLLNQEAPSPCPCPEAVSGLFHTYHCPSGANGIRDKHNKRSKSLSWWAIAPFSEFWAHRRFAIESCASKGKQSCAPLGLVSFLKNQRRKSSPGREHLNLSFASQNKMRQQLNSCKILNRVSSFSKYTINTWHQPHPHRQTHTWSVSSF